MKKYLFIFIIVICALIIYSYKKSNPERNNIISSTAKVDTRNTNVSITQKIKLPIGFEPVYSIINSEDLTYKNQLNNIIKRRSYRITLPKDLSKEDIQNNFQHLLIRAFEEYDKGYVSIFAYNSKSEIYGSYTIAMYEFCPYGDWGNDNIKASLSEWKENITFGTEYFENKNYITEGDKVVLFTKEKYDWAEKKFVPATKTNLSTSATNFNDDKISYIMPNGTKAIILEVYSKAMSANNTWVSYKVKTTGGQIGWVSEFDVKK